MSDAGSPQAGKPEEQTATEHLNIKVTDNNNEVFFKIKRTTALKKLMDAFCERQGKSPNTVRFLFDGTRVQPGDSPNSVRVTVKLSRRPSRAISRSHPFSSFLSRPFIGPLALTWFPFPHLQLEMQDGDTLEVHQEQTGGC